MTSDYLYFLRKKQQEGAPHGFEPLWLPDCMFPFQRHLAEWNIRQGRSATLADCGLGKSLIELVWGENVVRLTGKPVLLLTPLAVGRQMAREAAKFGVDSRVSSGDLLRGDCIVITNYEKLHHFSPASFGGVICDESSAIKSFDGARRSAVTEFMRTVPYRLLATATAAPNDYTELGTSSEALGEMGLTDMLTRFFRNDQNNVATNRSYGYKTGNREAGRPKFRFRGHARAPFWRWVCSWARSCRKPSDLGFSDDGFVLPPLVENAHVVEARTLPEGMLFPVVAWGMREEREERRRTIRERCERVADLVAHDRPATVWCHMNPEGDLLEKMIPGARQVKGSTSEEERDRIYRAFEDGSQRVLILKPKIGAWGMNWQHCSHAVTFASHSFEQYYQLVRRHWRFGQENAVVVDEVLTEGEARVLENRRRKAEAADRMFTELVGHMNDALRLDRPEIYSDPVEVPAWLSPTN